MQYISRIIKLTLPAAIGMALAALPSCMKDKPESLPDQLKWNPQLALPLGEEAFGMNGDSGFDTQLLQEDTISGLPLWMGQQTVNMEGTFAFDLSTLSNNLDKLNRILFRLNFTNQFPHPMYSQAYFRDGSGNDLDSIFREGPVETPAAVVGEQGTPTDPGRSRHDALIEGDRIPALAGASTILIRSAFRVEDVDTALLKAYPTFVFHVDSGLMLDLSFED